MSSTTTKDSVRKLSAAYQIAAIYEAAFWGDDDEDERTAAKQAAFANLDDDGMLLLGQMYKAWALAPPDPWFVGPGGTVIDIVKHYIDAGPDEEIRQIMRECASEKKEEHRKVMEKWARIEAAEWVAAGDPEIAAEVLAPYAMAAEGDSL